MDVGTGRFDKLIEWLLIALLAFMPFAFGAVEAWSEEVIIALAAAISIAFAAKLVFEPNARLVWSWAYVPVGLFILVAIVDAHILGVVINNVSRRNGRYGYYYYSYKYCRYEPSNTNSYTT